MTSVVALTQQLISIPSFVDDAHNESTVAQFVFDRLSADKRLSVEQLAVSPGRFNVLATTPGPCRLLLAGHLDTVLPSGGWTRSPFDATIEGGRLYGLGALDMKGGVAAVLSAVEATETLPDGLALVFYCDEEYDFAGMKSFVEGRLDWRPELVVVAEPSDELVWNSHRGVVELVVRVTGKSAHASRPSTGVNAIEEAVQLAARLRNLLEQNVDPVLGAITLNLAGISGGLIGADGEIVVQANAVPDVADMTLDIRTNAEAVDADFVVKALRSSATAQAPIESIEVRHNLGALNTPLDDVAPLCAAMEVAGLAVGTVGGADKGYGDGQMLRAAWGVPVVNFGPTGSGMHGADEFVDVASLERVEAVYRKLLQRFL